MKQKIEINIDIELRKRKGKGRRGLSIGQLEVEPASRRLWRLSPEPAAVLSEPELAGGRGYRTGIITSFLHETGQNNMY